MDDIIKKAAANARAAIEIEKANRLHVARCHIGFQVVVLKNGGSYSINDDDLPLGTLVAKDELGGTLFAFVAHNGAEPMQDQFEVGMAHACWKAGGKILIRDADVRRLPSQGGIVCDFGSDGSMHFWADGGARAKPEEA